MALYVFLAVLAAAVMHASWNAIVKSGLDRFSSILMLTLFQGLIALVLTLFFPLPAPAAWPWLFVSTLVHTGYNVSLVKAYEHGDLSQVYPLARGTAPLIVALVGALFLGEFTTPLKTLAIAAIGTGVIVMSLKGGAGLGGIPRKALGFALMTACFTASYTLLDGLGARAAGTASGYTMWLFVGSAINIAIYALATRGLAAFSVMTNGWKSSFAAGAMSLGSYWIAIWAFTLAPIALVAALRETSVLFAMLIAVVFLGEKAGAWRWAAAALILSGVALMRL